MTAHNVCPSQLCFNAVAWNVRGLAGSKLTVWFIQQYMRRSDVVLLTETQVDHVPSSLLPGYSFFGFFVWLLCQLLRDIGMEKVCFWRSDTGICTT